MTADSFALPPLRAELQIFSAPPATDGSSEYTIFDPVSGRYKRIGWAEATLLAQWRPGLSVKELVERVHQYTTLRTTVAEAEDFCRMAEATGLTATSLRRPAASLYAETEARRMSPLKWFFSHYLFLRVPLLYPDRLLAATLPAARALVSAPAVAAYILLGLAGLFMLAGRFDSYIHTFPHFFNLTGALAYGLTLIVVKGLHEFAHAYTAKAFGARVRSMGIVFIIFWPVPYSDVTDAWRLPTRGQRFMVGFAGILSETVLAGLCLFGWAWAPSGVLKSVFFLASSVTLVSTWLVNLNPAMRFDGYYLLSDAWGIENLQPRAFALTKWWLRRALLGLRVEPPEPVPAARRMAALIAYSLYAWAYRLGLYVGIALILYYKFAKIVGVVLLAVQAYQFFVRTVVNESKTLFALRRHLSWNRRSMTSVTLLGLLLLWLLLPLRREETLPAILVPARSQAVYVPLAGYLKDLRVQRGDTVREGDLLFAIDSPQLKAELQALLARVAQLEARMRTAQTREKNIDSIPEIREALAKARAELDTVREHESRACAYAGVDGRVTDWRNELQEGTAVARTLPIGRIADFRDIRVLAYVHEQLLDRIEADAEALFYPCDNGPPLAGRLAPPQSTPAAEIEYPSLTSLTGGEIAVMPHPDGRLTPLGAVYPAEMKVDTPPTTRLWQSGTLRVTTKPRSLAVAFFEYCWRVALRESDF